MRVYHDIRQIRLPGPTALTIGNFDGVHRGHQALFARLRALAGGDDPTGQSGVLTFDPHPARIIRPDTPLRLLSTPRERLALAARQGIDIGIIQPFDDEIVNMSANDFTQMLVNAVGLTHLVVGPDFALGRNRSGDLERLAQLGQEKGFNLTVLDEVQLVDHPVRSVTIRRALEAGEVELAASLLGRTYHVSGTVVEGERRGRTIGVPTANLTIPPDRMLPADGVYATWTWFDDEPDSEPRLSVTNIGVRPTVDGTSRRTEAHILNFPKPGESDNLYGCQLTLTFVARLRPEKRFESLEDLVVQIRQDIDEARQILSRTNSGAPPVALLIE